MDQGTQQNAAMVEEQTAASHRPAAGAARLKTKGPGHSRAFFFLVLQ